MVNEMDDSLISWLLEEENPSVRYGTLKDLLNIPQTSEQVLASRDKIMHVGYVPALLERMRSEEYVKRFPNFYTDKYKGLVWSLVTLAELGAQRTDQIGEYCEYLLDNSQENGHGGFSMHASAKRGGGRPSEVIPCLTGNLTWALLQFGYGEDKRVAKAINWLGLFSRFNDGVETETVPPPYDRYEMCWGRHTCFMATVKMLKALGAIPGPMRSKEIEDTIGRGVEFLLIHHIFKQSHDLKKKSKPGWLRLSFPLMYQTDLLEILDILTALGVQDVRMEEAILQLQSKQDAQNRWHLENTYINERLLIPLGNKGEASKELTLRALRVLKRSASWQ